MSPSQFSLASLGHGTIEHIMKLTRWTAPPAHSWLTPPLSACIVCHAPGASLFGAAELLFAAGISRSLAPANRQNLAASSSHLVDRSGFFSAEPV
jgi:hypothetical protein